ncbi:MAG: hypothetical protein Q8N85_03235 [Candidatus Omnitrophota bacterium]|nr:hypothetical protein [Candidatus Omnitrophota bacterium]
MRIKKFLPSMVLITAFVALGLIVRYQLPIKNFLIFNYEKARIYLENSFSTDAPGSERRRPLSLLVKETELALYVGEPFKDFSDEDWRKFWGLIYDIYPKDEPEKAGLPYRFRQLNQEEISAALIENYPQEFYLFQDEQWKMFFGILFEK